MRKNLQSDSIRVGFQVLQFGAKFINFRGGGGEMVEKEDDDENDGLAGSS